jgi:hypothetical protein
MMSSLIKNNNKGKLASASSQRGNVQMVPVPENFEIISDAEMAKIKRREKEYKHMQAKLTKINASERKELSRPFIPRELATPSRIRSQKELAEMAHMYAQSLMDPFGVRGIRVPSEIVIPTSVFSTTQVQEFDLTTTSDTGTLRVYAPCRYNGVWAASGTAGTYSNSKANPAYLGHPYLTYSSGWTTDYFPCAEGATGVSTLEYLTTTGKATSDMWSINTLAIDELFSDIVKLYSHVRRVSAGLRVTYMGEPLSAKGRVVVAQLPPGVNLPALSMGTTAITNANGYQTPTPFDLSFDQVALLPGAQIFESSAPFTAVVKPYDDRAEEWCPTKFNLRDLAWGHSGVFGTDAFPPCTSVPEQFIAEAELLALHSSLASTPADSLQFGNTFLRNAFYGNYGPWGNIVIVYDGCDTTASVQIEFTANYEGIPESRSLSIVKPELGHSGNSVVSAHGRALANHLPSAYHSRSGFTQKLSKFLKAAVSKSSAMIGAAGGGRALAEQLGSSLGIEIPAIFGDIAEGAAVVGSML